MSEKDRIPELFGSMSFNEGTMEQYVPHQAMEVWRDCLKSGKPLPLTAANDIAEAMKTWALEHGATHFTHWFQPLTGITAGGWRRWLRGPTRLVVRASCAWILLLAGVSVLAASV